MNAVDMDMARLAKLRAEVRKLSAESDRLMMETRWYPIVLVSAMLGLFAAALKLAAYLLQSS